MQALDVSLGFHPDHWLGVSLLATRVGAMMVAAPFFGVAAIPGTVRGAFALLVALLLFPSVPEAAEIANLPDLAGAVASEVLVGCVIGFTITLFFSGVQLAGEVVGVQMGIGAATALDPTSDVAMPVIGNLLYMMALALWFAIGGHLMMIAALADSFQMIPPGALVIGDRGLLDLALGLRVTLEAGIRIAAPTLVALLIVNAALAVLARTAPQMNVFALSFPITIAVGLVVLGLTLPGFASIVTNWTNGSYEMVGQALQMLSGG